MVADNCVVDQIGRLTSRNAFADYLAFEGKNNAEIVKIKSHIIDTNALHGTHDETPAFVYREGDVEEVILPNKLPVGQGKRLPVYRGRSLEITGTATYGVAMEKDGAIEDLTLPVGYDVDLLTAELVTYKDELYLFAKGRPFLKLDGDTFEPVDAEVKDLNGDTVTGIDGDVAISAYGRLWVTGVDNDYHTIYYSSLLDETQWYDASDTDGSTGNTGGFIDVREYWPVDSDTIVGIHAHNGFLFVFGRNSILIYANADAADPAGEDGIRLQDAISNVGLVRRDAVCNIGTDVLFVDESGVRSMGRVIQEKSTPIGEPSLNIRREIQEVINQELLLDPRWSGIRIEYMPSKSLAIMLCTGLRIAYVFHLNMPSKTGGFKITAGLIASGQTVARSRWRRVMSFTLAAGLARLLRYSNYVEGDEMGDPQPYIMHFESMALALGESPMQTSIPKSIHYILMGEYVPAKLMRCGDSLTG